MPKITRLNELEEESKTIKGRWKLDRYHRLNYVADDNGEKFQLDTSLIAAEEDALVFSWTGEKKSGRQVTNLARLSGKWRANDQNQIEFEVEKKSGASDVLTFRGGWKLGGSHEILYSYRARTLKRRTSTAQTLAFKGWWDITEQNRLTYLVEGSSDNALRFRGTFQTPSILAKAGEIRYQLGAEAEIKATGRSRRRTITLFGKWKLSDKLELVFEVECADGEKRELRFGAEFSPAKDWTVAANLLNKKGESLGLEVTLTREFLEGQAQAFVRLKKNLAESAVEGGITIPW